MAGGELKLKEIVKDKVVITRQAEQQKKILVSRIRPHKGHTLFEVNLSTGIVMEAKFEPQVADFHGRKQPKKVMVQKDCIYVPALNVKNLMKKLIKEGIVDPEAK